MREIIWHPSRMWVASGKLEELVRGNGGAEKGFLVSQIGVLFHVCPVFISFCEVDQG